MTGRILPKWQDGRLLPIFDKELTDFPNEEWKDIPWLEGYQISSQGRLKSISRTRYDILGREYFEDEKILTVSARKRKNNITVEGTIRFQQRNISFSVCRLVYYFFVANFDLGDRTKVVVIKDGNELNCHFKNLDLVTVSKNITDDYRKGRKEGFKKRKIHQYDTNGLFVRTFDSVIEASKLLNVNHSSIYNAATLLYYRCRGHFWRFGLPIRMIDVSGFNARRIVVNGSRKRPIQISTAEGTVIERYESIAAAARILKIDENMIRRACRKSVPGAVKDYYLSYAE